MNSIDKLREYGARFNNSHDAWSGIGCEILKIADEIEREVADMVPLPVDADGVPIRAGDVMEERSGHTFEVASLMAFGGSDNWLVLSDPRNFSSFREPHDLHHHHAPTVEDVLREFAYGLGVPVADSYVAATVAKLRLAEGVDE